VPDEGVATDREVVLSREVDDGFSARQGELVAARLSRIPLHVSQSAKSSVDKRDANCTRLHRILRSNLAEVLPDDVCVGLDVEGVGVTASTPVLLALGLEARVQAASSRRRVRRGRGLRRGGLSSRGLRGRGLSGGGLRRALLALRVPVVEVHAGEAGVALLAT
jgi:hypothetical protein